jgi:hypothetical protein
MLGAGSGGRVLMGCPDAVPEGRPWEVPEPERADVHGAAGSGVLRDGRLEAEAAEAEAVTADIHILQPLPAEPTAVREKDGAVVDMGLERTRRETDNAKLTPRELIALVAAELDNGELGGKPLRCVVIIETEKSDGNHGIETFRSGCSRYEEIALIALHSAKQLEDWRNS